MLLKNNLHLNHFFSKTIRISVILTLSILPFFMLLSTVEASWVSMVSLIWIIGSIVSFYPFVKYLYPHLMSRTGFYLLTSVLIIFSAWVNITAITLLIPSEYLYYALFNATLHQISLVGSMYIFIVDILIIHFALNYSNETYQVEELF